MRETAPLPRGPRPVLAFLLSLFLSSAALALLLFSDGQVLELTKARAEIVQLDHQIAQRRHDNDRLRAAIEAANQHDFPAEKVAREDLHLVASDDLVLLFPDGSLSGAKPTPAPSAGTPRISPTKGQRVGSLEAEDALDAPGSLR